MTREIALFTSLLIVIKKTPFAIFSRMANPFLPLYLFNLSTIIDIIFNKFITLSIAFNTATLGYSRNPLGIEGLTVGTTYLKIILQASSSARPSSSNTIRKQP